MVLVGARTIAQSTVSFFIGEVIIAADFEVRLKHEGYFFNKQKTHVSL
jgi:hypothetical protein